jgi:Domain of unknown function (DUF4432)
VQTPSTSRLGRDELLRRVGRVEQVGGVRLLTFGDGLERGVRILEFRAGPLSFDVLVDRAFDIGRCELAGQPISWLSPAGVVGPWYAEHSDWGWFRTFGGGLMVTCGLDHTGGPGEDSTYPHTPDRQVEQFGLHGRAGMLPARLHGYGERWDGDRCVLWAEGEVRQAAPFVEALTLRRRIEVDLGGRTIRISDEVENLGSVPSAHMLLYHMNVGWPVLDDGAELLVPATDVRPVDGGDTAGYRLMGPPVPGAPERVFEHEVAAGPDGLVTVALVNRAVGMGFVQRFRASQLPFHNVWRMLGAGMYVVGLEPGTNRDSGRWEARRRGELLELAPGEIRRYALEIGVLVGEDEIDAAAADVSGALAAAAAQRADDASAHGG